VTVEDSVSAIRSLLSAGVRRPERLVARSRRGAQFVLATLRRRSMPVLLGAPTPPPVRGRRSPRPGSSNP